MKRRHLLAAGLMVWVRPSEAALPDELQAAVAAYTGGRTPTPGRVRLEVAPLVENGNTVPLSVSADSPMTEADHVRQIAVFNQKNPERDVVRFAFTPRSGRAWGSTRIRLASSQTLVAVARMSDGSVWSHSVDVAVTLAACID